MKDKLITIIQQIKPDAKFVVNRYSHEEGIEGTYRSGMEMQPFVATIIENAQTMRIHPSFRDTIVIDEKYGIYPEAISSSIPYETADVAGFEEYISKYNKYNNIFVKFDEDAKTITFKLGSKSQTLRLVEHTKWTHKYMAQKKELLISTIDSFRAFIKDPFWDPSIQAIGRRVLKLDSVIALR